MASAKERLLMQPLGIVILSFNHHQLTSECVTSVLAYTPDVPLFLVHNGSDPRQVDTLLKKFSGTLLSNQDKKEEVIKNNIYHLILSNNSGFSGGANQGLTLAFKYCHWVLFLTNDTLLKQLPANLPDQPGLYTPLIIVKRNNKIDSLGGYLQPGKGHLSHLKTASEFAKIKSSSKCQFIYAPGTAFLIDDSTFRYSGGFDSRLGTYWEDVDLSLFLQTHRKNIDILEDLHILHKVGKTCHKDTHYTTFLFQRNRLIISWKYGNTLDKIQLVLVLLYETGKRGLRDFKNKKPELFRLYLEALLQGVKMIITDKKAPQKMSKG